MNDKSLELVIGLFEFVILLFSLSFHECAHAWMASRLGDQTARLQGRVSMNPIRHIDPIGTLLFPALMIFGPIMGLGIGGFLVGWAKPTPVITRNFKHIRRDDNLTTLAGPVSNLVLLLAFYLVLIVLMIAVPGGKDAVGGAMAFDLTSGTASTPQAIALFAYLAVNVNLALMFFNLLPIPPLDGSHVLRNLLPYNALNTYDRIAGFGFFFILIIGRPIIGFFMRPSMHLINSGLLHFLQ